MSWLTIGVTVAGAALSAGTAAASASAARKAQPDLASSSAELSQMRAEYLPIQRALEAGAQQGTKVTIQNYPAHNETQKYVYVPEDRSSVARESVLAAAGNPVAALLDHVRKSNPKSIEVPYVPSEWEAGGKYADLGAPPWFNKSVPVPAGPKTIDFTGLGAADANAAVAKASAQLQLGIQQKYGVPLAESNAALQKLADPEGYAARQKEAELIQKQIDTPQDLTINNELDRQIGDRLNAGSGLTAEEKAMLDQSVRSGGDARGGVDTSADFTDPITQGWAGEARLQGGQKAAAGWLTSGATPQDATYRRSQQNISNLSALTNGRTPESQFSNLSGQGPTPFTAGQPMSQVTNNGNAGQQNAINSYQAQLTAQQQQANPWMAGMSGLLSAGNAWAAGHNTGGT